MARWKLMTAHYLNAVQPVQWEYNEVRGGKSVRARYNVPRLLDPKDPSDWTHKWGQRGNFGDGEEGEIIVCLGDPTDARDIELPAESSITPDMMPIDDEAKVISAKYETHWSYKPDGAETSFSQSLVDSLKSTFEEARPQTVQVEGLSDVLSQLAATQKLLVEAMSNPARRV